MTFGTDQIRRTMLTWLGGCVLGICSFASAQATIEIKTADGRLLTGEIDSRTDSNTLWIRNDQEGIVLTTAVPWDEVATARLDSSQMIADDMSQLVTSEPAAFLTEYEVFDYDPVAAKLLLPALAPHSRVIALEVHARLANLDRTVEPDGISVAVAPIDAHGEIIPVCGSVSVRLVGEFVDQFTGRVSFAEVESWNATITESMYADDLAMVRLRFRQLRPEFDLDLCTSALVNVRLGVPGVGNFEASAPVELRRFNPFREQLQYYEGSRFYSNELTHNTKQSSFRAFNSRFTP
ncbi:hypothetical protein [Bythopirellula goksoeyrii]|uniref:SLA1 homology domain-containing protein n=1 Tax=Bythopirellula goksoeyrii TaxID=1400387 RepID=A0A5B9Q9G0_9BACT|nr:hypothetical protein [Bythopirellula goksoeyrii]QEG34215.1 hypothetical protein Pr1d_14880 [Bythopirellula goksoeyrii]